MPYIAVRESRFGMADTARSVLHIRMHRMAHIFPASKVFKVYRAVIIPHPINMVDFFALRQWANECASYNAMNKRIGMFCPNRKDDRFIAILFSRARAQNPILFAFWCSAAAHNPTQVRHGIKTFVASDGFPYFIRKFFGGKFLFSHSGNLLSRFAFWLGSFGVSPSFEPSAF